MLRALVLAAVLILTAGTAAAQQRWPSSDWGGGRPGWFDAVAEGNYDASGRPVAHLSLTIPYRNLIFLRGKDGRFHCDYRVRVVQYDESGRDVRVKEYDGEVVVDDYDATRDTTPLKRTLDFPLRIPPHPGAEEMPSKIRLVVQVEIDHSHRWGRRELTIGVPRASSQGVALGDPIVYRSLLPRIGEPDASWMVRVEGEVDPARFVRVSLPVFDLSSGPPFLLVRVYDLGGKAEDDSVTVELRTRADDSKESGWSRIVRLPAGKGGAAALVRVPPSGLQPGRNHLWLHCSGADSREVEVEDFGLDPTDDRQWKQNLRVIEAVASPEEMDTLEAAPPQRRVLLWEEFWKRRDPDPRTAENEVLQEHVRRVAYARRNYRDGGKDGAISDRGRVYVELGPPDSIESQTMLQDGSSEYEIWHYLGPGVSYWFRDNDGLGHWRLIRRQEN